MVSDAGDAVARRRRDLRSWFLLFSFFSVNLPKYPTLSSSVFFFSNRHLCNGERKQCLIISVLIQTSSTNLSLNLTTEFLQPSNDIFGQTLEQYLDDTSNGSRSGPSLAPPTAHPHRFSLMAGIFLGPSDAPLPVGSSTAHDETQSWQVAPVCDSSPIIISEPQNGGDNSSLFPPTTTTLGFSWMGLISFCGPITLIWPMIENCKEAQFTHILQALCMLTDPSPSLSKSRYTPFNVLSRSLLKIWCLIKDGRRRHPILVATSSDQTCFHQFQNLMDRIDGLSSDANLKLKHIGLVLISNHRWCDANQASVMFCEHISSKTLSNIKLNNQASSHMGEASQHSRTISRQIEQTYSVKEIPFLQPYSVVGNQTLSVASSMEQIIKSSYASVARAIYDHKLIRNFKLEFLKVSKDFSTFANSLKLCTLDYSLSLYLFFSCIGLLSACMNFSLLRI